MECIQNDIRQSLGHLSDLSDSSADCSFARITVGIQHFSCFLYCSVHIGLAVSDGRARLDTVASNDTGTDSNNNNSAEYCIIELPSR